MEPRVMPERIKEAGRGKGGQGPVLYWMSRDQRVHDNWALLAAQDLALTSNVGLGIVFCLAPSFLEASHAHYRFMMAGLQETAGAAEAKGIPFLIRCGYPPRELARLVRHCQAAGVVTDFDPLRIKREWLKTLVSEVSVPVLVVDAHNLVPCWETSPKQEYAAYTLRPKLYRALPRFLAPFPPVLRHPIPWRRALSRPDWNKLTADLPGISRGPEAEYPPAGAAAGRTCLDRFLAERLAGYDRDRNDPTISGQSGLSPYLHFGQLAPQRVVLEVTSELPSETSRDSFLEEIIIRRELSDNFCYYNPAYDSTEGFPDWARRTLAAHEADPRGYHYSEDQLEGARTHDRLWNAAQIAMMRTGKLHGYLRMYWAKKILEWTETADEALEMGLKLNNRYELDGRDPNGYVGVAWAIGGVHDRAWKERPILGKLRYMSYRGARRKFDVDRYVAQVEERTGVQIPSGV